MNYSAALTTELGADFQSLVDLFNRVFDEQRTPAMLRAKYTAPGTGYSFHGLMKDEDRLVGALTVIPFTYTCFGQQLTFGCFADLMIDEDARGDMLALKKIYDAAMQRIGDEIDLVYAVPNENSYLYFRKFLKWREIGDLYYYLMPVQIGAIRERLGWLNPVSWLGSRLFCLTPGLSSAAAITRNIHKMDAESFRSYRFAENYESGEVRGSTFYYRLFDEEATRVCYIVDIQPLSPRALDAAVARIRSQVKCDAIMYIDSVPMTPHKAIRVPRKWEPRNLHLIARAVTDRVDERVMDVDNWQFNLSDFDVR